MLHPASRKHCTLPDPPGTNGLALTFLERPAIRLGAGAAHQRCPFGVAQAVTLKEGLDGLLIVDDRKRARPVRAPQAAIETPHIEHAGKRVPNVRERIRFPGQRAGAGDLDHRVWALGEFQHLREVGPGLRRRRRHARLHDAQMRVGWRAISAVPASKLHPNRMLTGKSWRTAARRIRSRPGSFGSRFASFVSMMRIPTAPGVFFQSAMTSATAGSSGSTGLTMANRPGWACCTSTA